VVVVPKDLAIEVLLEVEEMVAMENEIRKELKGGEHPLNVYLKDGRF
jgi:regulator of RNase E activity RraA